MILNPARLLPLSIQNDVICLEGLKLIAPARGINAIYAKKNNSKRSITAIVALTGLGNECVAVFIILTEFNGVDDFCPIKNDHIISKAY
jgi:hypothetical protein